MGILQEPTDTVCKLVSLPRWEREWINSHRNINFSGLVQQMIVQIIKEHDKKYFEENKHLLEKQTIYQLDVITSLVQRHPSLKPNMF